MVATRAKIKRSQLMAQALQDSASSTAPVGHWTQALARVVQGGVGGYQAGKADKMEGERSQALADALGGGKSPDELRRLGLEMDAPELTDMAGDVQRQNNFQQGFDYGVQRDQTQDQFRQNQFDYQMGRDTQADEWRDKNFDYQQGRDQTQDQFRNKAFDYGVASDTQKMNLEQQKLQTAGRPDFKDVTSIRKEIGDLPAFKAYSAVIPVYNSMVNASDNKAGDLNLVYGLAKMYDPDSVVREGEQVLVRDIASLPDWLVGNIQALNGGARLLPETRQNILGEAKTRADAYKSNFETQVVQYKDIAKRWGMNDADLIPQMGGFEVSVDEALKKYGGQ